MSVALLSLATIASASFGPATHFNTGDEPVSIAADDLNDDGISDLAVANEIADDLTVSIGNGDGTFAAPISYAAGDSPSAVAIGELSGDDQPDVAVSNRGSNSISVFTNNGDGTLTEAENWPIAPATGPSDVAIADLNHDARQDMVVTASGNDRIVVMLQNSGGDFDVSKAYVTGFDLGALVVGNLNFNGEAYPEVVVTRPNADKVTVFFTHPAGALTPGATKNVGDNPAAVAIGNLSQDHHPDLAVANSGSDDVSILKGTGGGDFEPESRIAAGNGPSAVEIAELNGGPRGGDVIVTNEAADSVSVLMGTGDGASFWPETHYGTGDEPSSVAITDTDGDHYLDLVTANAASDDASVIRSLGPLPEAVTTSIDFPGQTVDTTSEPMHASIANNAIDHWLEFSDATITGPDSDQFALGGGDTCLTWAVGPTPCSMPVRFAPTRLGPAEATLELEYNDTRPPITFPISGTGIDAPPGAVCPAVLYRQKISDFDPSPPYGTGKRVNGIRVKLKAPPGMVSRIKPVMRYGNGAKELTVHLRKRTIRVNGHNRMRFLLPPEIARRIRKEGKRAKGSIIRLRLNSTIYYPRGQECAQSSMLNLRTMVVGISKRAGLRRLPW